MKKQFLYLLLMALPVLGWGQNGVRFDVMPVDTILQKAYRENISKHTQDDWQRLANLFNGVANFVSEDSSSNILLNASLYGLEKIFSKDTDVYTLDKNIQTHLWKANLQFNAGVSPQTQATVIDKSVRSEQVGVTYALLNNKFAPAAWYKEIVDDSTQEYSLYTGIQDSIVRYEARNPGKAAAIIEYINTPPADGNEASLPQDFKDLLANSFGITNLKKFTDSLHNAVDSIITARLRKRPLLTVSCNSYYDQADGRWKNVDFLSNFSYFPSARNKKSISASAKYSVQNDTLINSEAGQGSNLFRALDNFSLNANFPVIFGAKRLTYFELKPAFTYTHIFCGLYNGEHTDTYTGQVTVNIDIPGTKNFSIPVTVVYDITHPEFLGFLSLQYSL